MNFESTDFSIAVLLKTTLNGTIISKTGGSWTTGDIALLVDQSGLASYQINGIVSITSKTKVNDGQWHEVGVVYTVKENR